ncbi:MAG: MATE family efflux transporter, partial [Eubacterium sp.]|nr:MATE family efflux transporter [Eubacterium sp.]
FCTGATVLALVFYLLAELAPSTVRSWFITDKNIVAMGVHDFRVLFSTYITLGIMITVITLFQSLGKASKASVLVLLRQIVLFIPMALLLPKINTLGIHGVFLAPALTDGFVFVLSLILLLTELSNLKKLKNKSQLQSIS